MFRAKIKDSWFELIERHLMKKNAHLDNCRAAAEVTDAIQCITTIPTESLSVRVREGWVFLGGELKSRHEKDFVAEVVRHLPGVRGVTNLIVVDLSPASRN